MIKETGRPNISTAAKRFSTGMTSLRLVTRVAVRGAREKFESNQKQVPHPLKKRGFGMTRLRLVTPLVAACE
jgi:hypothetical protein